MPVKFLYPTPFSAVKLHPAFHHKGEKKPHNPAWMEIKADCQTSLSFTTVVLSDVVWVLLPRMSAMIRSSRIIPPTTHIHGWVYHVELVVVVVLVRELSTVLSCAIVIN